MIRTHSCLNCFSPLGHRPAASASIIGSKEYPNLRGTADFYQTDAGVVVAAEITGLPTSADRCESPVFGFHIHSGNRCTGNASDPFANVMTHYNPDDCPHPHHAGDLPPLFGNDGYAFMAVLTNRFDLRDIIGKTIIIHSKQDDFTTQPSGNSGEKIACGVIRKLHTYSSPRRKY